MKLIVGTDHSKHHWEDKPTNSTVCALRADGGITHWQGARFECDVLYLEGDDENIAAWLTAVRNRNLQLCRSNGWYLMHHLIEVEGRSNAIHAILFWFDDEAYRAYRENWEIHSGNLYPWPFIGPLMDIGVLFLDWRKTKQQKKLQYEQELVELASARAHAEATAEEDARLFEDIQRVMDAVPT